MVTFKLSASVFWIKWGLKMILKQGFVQSCRAISTLFTCAHVGVCVWAGAGGWAREENYGVIRVEHRKAFVVMFLWFRFGFGDIHFDTQGGPILSRSGKARSGNP